jgi:hypothetical protein
MPTTPWSRTPPCADVRSEVEEARGKAAAAKKRNNDVRTEFHVCPRKIVFTARGFSPFARARPAGAAMVGLATFMIVSREDVPQYEADLGTSGGAPRKEDAAHLHQFVMHAALDFVDERQWETGGMYLRGPVDRFNDMLVYAFVTASGARFLLLHDTRNEEPVRAFFHDVHELYLKARLDPFFDANAPISSEAFDRRVRRVAERHFA